MSDKQHIISFNIGSGKENEDKAGRIKQQIKVFCAETSNIPQGICLQAMVDFCLGIFREKFQTAVMSSIAIPAPEPEPEPVLTEIPQTGEPESLPPDSTTNVEEIMKSWIESGDVVECPSGVSEKCVGYVHKTALQNGICPSCYEKANL